MATVGLFRSLHELAVRTSVEMNEEKIIWTRTERSNGPQPMGPNTVGFDFRFSRIALDLAVNRFIGNLSNYI
ncbi:hypothetical protein EUGRSUZ_D02044 [Eucalyptus grandis]|uniref:Uncharacterized protein n=2 Tax=Eucalyptus grandis TaxID=71139 RepID=A0ACC3L6X5_EUCGR|nr:hypothetical protein EUGRSUZ_D02044 [Eucalyptus grandis]